MNTDQSNKHKTNNNTLEVILRIGVPSLLFTISILAKRNPLKFAFEEKQNTIMSMTEPTIMTITNKNISVVHMIFIFNKTTIVVFTLSVYLLLEVCRASQAKGIRSYL